jgi:thiol-disulfide isomerase/thioredoxin
MRLLPLLLAALLTASCGLQRGLDGSAAGAEGGQAPEIAATTLDGSRFSTAAAAGHPVVINFWASWCGPCRAEQPELNALHDRYSKRGVVFAGVDLRDDDASARAFVTEFKVPYPSVTDDGPLAGAYNVAAPPETVVIDARGKIVKRLLGTTVGVADALDGLLR